MFTGLVQALGTVETLNRNDDGARIAVSVSPLAAEITTGDSIAVNGVCLTAVETDDEGFVADAVLETLQRSSLGALEIGRSVNIELAVRAGDRLGGHVVQGHVDGLGNVASILSEGDGSRIRVGTGTETLRYIVEKGSITVDGVSLTVAAIDDTGFEVALIPETLQRTTLGTLEDGEVVNLEVDVIAKYVEKLIAPIVART